MLEVMIDNKAGMVMDISQLVSEATWKTSRIGKPGSFDFSHLPVGNLQISNGDIVRAKWNDKPLFYGYVFTVGGGKDASVSVKCYDQLRYLSNNDTYVFKQTTAAAVLKKICDDTGLKWGTVEDTKYRMNLVEDNQKLMDIVYKALDKTAISGYGLFNLYDDFGKVTLRNAKEMKLDFMIGDKSLMYDYQYESSIDEAYNRVKLVQDNKQTKKRDVYIEQDSANIAKWGKLQYFVKVEDDKNEAQIKQLISNLLQWKNQEKKTLKIDALGNPAVRAGCYIQIEIEDIGINTEFLIDECNHKFDGDDYTLSLELKVIK